MRKRLGSVARIIAIFCLALDILMPAFTYGQSDVQATALLILSEVKVRNDSTGYDEYIELYNAANYSVALDEYILEYFNSVSPTADQLPTAQASVDSEGHLLAAGKFLVLAKNSSQIPNAKISPFSSLADGGGRLKLKDATGALVDEVAWTNTGSPTSPIVLVTSSNAANKSITRGNDTNGNPMPADSFALAPVSPHSDQLLAPPVVAPPPPPSYLPIAITELFVDPVSPQTDANDEFVELYNPNPDPVNLKDYVIKTGSNFQYHYTIPELTIEPDQYLAFYVKETKLVLSNSGGQAQVFDPGGSESSELVAYDDAEAGQSWSLIDNIWQWTTTLTPGARNSLGRSGSDTSDNTAPTGPFAPLIINELLANPASPQKDADDEFVELYNPNSVSVNTGGYQLLTGSSLKTKLTLPDEQIPPGGYKVYYSKDANVSLSNSGGEARLLDPSNNIVNETGEYAEAADGDAWARFESGWQWTGTPTPGTANVLSASAQAVKVAKSKAAATKKASTAKAKTTAAKKAAKTDAFTPAAIPVSPLSTALVATSAGLALLYGLYEFRYDIRNRFQVAKQYFEHRWHSGP